MQVAIPLDKMTTLEKLRVIEDVWDDLCHSKEAIPSPAWHADVLRFREQQIRNGESTFLELNEAKRVLRERLA
jgi:Putative addiction module component